ncbi:hypothetical protein M422DRAFT_68695 [Sphaerobolus stellatus SS14]|uniref:Unplaced genomic scaffold SPHSTscaffold_73, whole genome shotgun sequence n=1 Tax=Sphaerobolus stellatus (strain SS14) TaxID=990650 RepID=A0A0C9VPU7_SPHS4|nr:hypothetical protein M422DRAFT_68695 [Sphaerobolus stellatus SS14]
MVKPSALASELRALNIDTRVSGTVQTPTPATGTSTLAITPAIPFLDHANEILDNHTQDHTNTAEQRAPEGTESGGLRGVAMSEGDNATSCLPTMELDSQEIQMEDIDVRNDVGSPVVYGKIDGMAAGVREVGSPSPQTDSFRPNIHGNYSISAVIQPGVTPPQAVPNAASVADPVALPFQTPITKKISGVQMIDMDLFKWTDVDQTDRKDWLDGKQQQGGVRLGLSNVPREPALDILEAWQ